MGAGRKPKEIDQEQFEKLCGLQCTRDEICGWFNITDKTLNSWCKRTYGCLFSKVYESKRTPGKVALRRYQFKMAEKSAPMAIWLGKQWLGQTDKVIAVHADASETADPLSAAFEALAAHKQDAIADEIDE